MNWNKHSDLIGQHAFLSASKYHWLNYSKEHLAEAWQNQQAALRGTELHEFAANCIRLGQKLYRSKNTLNMYVNDAISLGMTAEQPLFYSRNCYGTADAISFARKNLRIHDLKTGIIPAHMEQLEIYASLFCLEYDEKPKDIHVELRIYQNNEIIVHEPEIERIQYICDKIVEFDKIIEFMKAEENP